MAQELVFYMHHPKLLAVTCEARLLLESYLKSCQPSFHRVNRRLNTNPMLHPLDCNKLQQIDNPVHIDYVMQSIPQIPHLEVC